MISSRHIGLADLDVRGIEDFNAKGLRGQAPCFFVCPLQAIGHTSIIATSPLQSYLAGLRSYPAFDDSLARYTSDLASRDDIYEGVLHELKRAKLTKDTFPKALFRPYGGWGAFGTRSASPFGKKSPGLALDKRLASWLVPDAAVSNVEAYLNRILEEVGADAFVEGNEDLNRIVSDPRFSEIPANSGVPYQSADHDPIAKNRFDSEEEERATLRRLEELVEGAGSSRFGVLNLFPLHLAKLAPSVFVSAGGARDCTAWKRAFLRARLINALACVWHYPSVLLQLERLRNLSSGTCKPGQSEVLRELVEYRESMERKYPVILDNPLGQAQ